MAAVMNPIKMVSRSILHRMVPTDELEQREKGVVRTPFQGLFGVKQWCGVLVTFKIHTAEDYSE